MGASLLALVAMTVPAAAEEETNADWLGVVGDFVMAGLGPARTVEDIRRQEERAREAYLRDLSERENATEASAAPSRDEAEIEVKGVAEDEADTDADVAIAPVPDITSDVPAPVTVPVTAAAGPVPVAPEAVAHSLSKPVQQAGAPAPEAVAKPVVSVAVRVVPPPEPLVSRIAATATVDQAIRLGGSSDTYDRRFGSLGPN